jgi:exosortase
VTRKLLSLSPVFALLVALAFLWWRLLDHLRWEWTINPQYAYGWVVPFLCLYLAWHRVRERWPEAPERKPDGQPTATESPARWLSMTRCVSHLPGWIRCGIATLLALLWLPARLIQDANPEWRLVSWVLAFEVLALTLVVVDSILTTRAIFFNNVISSSGWGRWIAQCGLRTADLVFPICFILVAVPWPSLIEEPLIQALTRTTAGLTSEALNLLGLPSVAHGNLVEVGHGVVGIDEACCGIRSFQSALMLALLFGGLYRLSVLRRLGLVFAGFVLAFGFNVVRTTLLASVAATKGMSMINAWHNPAGLLIPVACFLLLALLARASRAPRREGKTLNRGAQIEMGSQMRVRWSVPMRPPGGQNAEPNFCPRILWRPLWIGFALIPWLVLAELGTEMWYRMHESRLPVAISWSIVVPQDVKVLDQASPSAMSRKLLRFDAGSESAWQDAAGRDWQAIFLCWKPGRIASRLAKDHTPAVCLGAAGRRLLAEEKSQTVRAQGLQMQVDYYVATDPRGKVHVLYCLREDRLPLENRLPSGSIWQERLAPVFAGRRNCGQRSLELAVWGIENDAEARTVLIEQMQKLVRIDDRITDS